MKRFVIILTFFLGIIFIAFLMFCNSMTDFFGVNDKRYSKTELAENYMLNSNKISELISYFNSICPKDKIIEIEFENDEKAFRLSISERRKIENKYAQEYNMLLDSKEADSIYANLHWSRKILLNLKQKLDDANCISINNNEPHELGFKRSGLGMYSFIVYKMPMNDSLQSYYRERCEFLIYNRNVLFKYGGGAIDSDCFPENRK